MKFYLRLQIHISKDMKQHFEDGIRMKRPRGKDKAKERYERNGGYSTKHLRLKENLNKKTKS